MTTLLLNLRLVAGLLLVAALAFSHFSAYRKGRQDVLTAQMAATAEANEDARRLERARQSRADQSSQIRSERENSIRAAANRAGDAVSQLRDTLDATERASQSSLQACTKAVSALRAVHGSCVEEYRSMGQEAAGHSADSMMYQEAWPE